MKLKPITGVGMIPKTIYFIDVEGGRVEVEKQTYKMITESLGNGDVWYFDEEEQRFLKYGTQINLF